MTIMQEKLLEIKRSYRNLNLAHSETEQFKI